MGTRRSTTGLESADLGERSNERRGRALCAVADGGELGSDLNGPAPLARERGVDGVPTLLLLVPPGVDGRWLEDGVEERWAEDGVDGRWVEDGVLGLPLLLMGDSFGPDLPMATSIRNGIVFPSVAESRTASGVKSRRLNSSCFFFSLGSNKMKKARWSGRYDRKFEHFMGAEAASVGRRRNGASACGGNRTGRRNLDGKTNTARQI